jgi:hypothetical protein
MRRDRRQQHRIAQQLVQRRQILGQLPDLDRQRLVPQRLRLRGHQSQHYPLLSPETRHMQGILVIRPDGTRPSAGYFFRGK